MALYKYMQATQLLLNDPMFAVYNDADVVTYINTARGQIAQEMECIRAYATLDVDNTAQQYAFSLIDLTGYAGVQGVLNVRQVTYTVASGQGYVATRPFPWFNSFILAQAVPEAGAPSTWSQFGQGAQGSLFINLLDGPYELRLDTQCYPTDLSSDTDPEAIPYNWRNAVPYYAAYQASLPISEQKASTFYKIYDGMTAIGRKGATPGVLPTSFAQPADPFLGNRLGLPKER